LIVPVVPPFLVQERECFSFSASDLRGPLLPWRPAFSFFFFFFGFVDFADFSSKDTPSEMID